MSEKLKILVSFNTIEPMTIEQAREFKQELKIYEGKTLEEIGLTVWKVMICGNDTPLSDMITRCRMDFNADDLQDGWEDYDVYVLYHNRDSNISHERAVKFSERLQTVE
jgi:hypothetical protein